MMNSVITLLAIIILGGTGALLEWVRSATLPEVGDEVEQS